MRCSSFSHSTRMSTNGDALIPKNPLGWPGQLPILILHPRSPKVDRTWELGAFWDASLTSLLG